MSALDKLPARIVEAALNESVFLDGVWEADAAAKTRKSGKVVGYATNYEGDRIKITAEYVKESDS